VEVQALCPAAPGHEAEFNTTRNASLASYRSCLVSDLEFFGVVNFPELRIAGR